MMRPNKTVIASTARQSVRVALSTNTLLHCARIDRFCRACA